jgi:hypothetical protein
MSARDKASEILRNVLEIPQDDAIDFVDYLVTAVYQHGVERGVIKKPEPPELIQGYAAEQWQEIIDGGYLCEFWGGSCTEDCQDKPIGILEIASEGEGDYFQIVGGDLWTYCRPAQIKGVIRPIWVEPVDEKAFCTFFSRNNYPVSPDGLTLSGTRHSYDRWAKEAKENGATSYIEL